jgi:hypothetical protein
MEPESTLLYSQQPATGPYHDPEYSKNVFTVERLYFSGLKKSATVVVKP